MTGHGLKNNKPAGLDRAWRGRALTFEPLLLALFACLLINPSAKAQQRAPELLSYDELVQLHVASTSGVRPLLPNTARLGRFLRVVQWNVERGNRRS